MKRYLIRLLEWLTGENVVGLRESLRVTVKLSQERENALLKIHELLTPGEPWYSWQRVFQSAQRLLDVKKIQAVRAALLAEDICPDCLGELDTGWECNGCGRDFAGAR